MSATNEAPASRVPEPGTPDGGAVTVNDLDLPVFDYTEPGLVGEVYHDRLAAVRQQGWLARSPLTYVVLDRESGEFFLRARQTAFPGREIAEIFGVTGGRLREQIDANILNATGERHRRLRALIGPAFTPRAADRWRPAMRGFLDRLWHDLGDVPPGGPAGCDFVAAFAKPYPSLTIAAVLGAPPQDAPRLHEWSGWVQKQFDIRALASEPARIERAVGELYEYVETLLERRRREPSDDLISTLLAAEEEGVRLTHEECVNLVLNVVAGGIDTTQAQLSHAMRLFAAHPAQWAALARDPGLVPAAVEEVLQVRADHPVHRPDLHRSHRAPRRAVPGGHHRRDLRGAGQPGRRGGRRVRHRPRLRRAPADVRRGPALLPGLQPGPGRTGRGAHLPRPPDDRAAPRGRGPAGRRGGHLRHRIPPPRLDPPVTAAAVAHSRINPGARPPLPR